MRFLPLWALLLLLGSCAPAPGQARKAKAGPKYYVILMGGQSNMAGMGKVAELPDHTLPGKQMNPVRISRFKKK